MAERSAGPARPVWLTVVLFFVVFVGALIVLRPIMVGFVEPRILADALIGGIAGLVAWPIANWIVARVVKQ